MLFLDWKKARSIATSASQFLATFHHSGLKEFFSFEILWKIDVSKGELNKRFRKQLTKLGENKALQG